MEEDPSSSSKSATLSQPSNLSKRAPSLHPHQNSHMSAKHHQHVDIRFKPLLEIVQGLMLSGCVNKEAVSKLSRSQKALLNTIKKRISDQQNRNDSAARVVLSFVKKFIVRETRDLIKHGNSTNPMHYIKSREINAEVFCQYYSEQEKRLGTNPTNIWSISGGPTIAWFKKLTVHGTNFKLYDKILELLCHETEPILNLYKEDKIVKNCSRLFSHLPEDQKAALAQIRRKLRAHKKSHGSKHFSSQPKFPLTLSNFQSAISQTIERLEHLKRSIRDRPDL